MTAGSQHRSDFLAASSRQFAQQLAVNNVSGIAAVGQESESMTEESGSEAGSVIEKDELDKSRGNASFIIPACQLK